MSQKIQPVSNVSDIILVYIGYFLKTNHIHMNNKYMIINAKHFDLKQNTSTIWF